MYRAVFLYRYSGETKAQLYLFPTKCFLEFIRRYFVEPAPALPSPGQLNATDKQLDVNLERIIGMCYIRSILILLTNRPYLYPVYPIKSCKGFQITESWEIGEHGFMYDREWMVVDETGHGINQKKVLREGGLFIASTDSTSLLYLFR